MDGGPIEFATGTANYVDGSLISYTAASGDVFEFIADRFQLDLAYLTGINSVRRTNWDLYVGDTVNLSAFHMFSVGDQNGEVAHNDPPNPYPLDQREADTP